MQGCGNSMDQIRSLGLTQHSDPRLYRFVRLEHPVGSSSFHSVRNLTFLVGAEREHLCSGNTDSSDPKCWMNVGLFLPRLDLLSHHSFDCNMPKRCSKNFINVIRAYSKCKVRSEGLTELKNVFETTETFVTQSLFII